MAILKLSTDGTKDPATARRNRRGWSDAPDSRPRRQRPEPTVRAAVDAAAGAAAVWSATTPQHRSELLRRAFELMIAHSDELAALIVAEMGKPLAEAKGEAVFAAEFFRWYSGEAVRNQGAVLTAPAGDKRIISVHQPVGVALLITPFNFPASMATRKIAPAIAAGCTMIL